MLKLISIQIPRKTEQWFKALLAAVISGMSNSFLSAIGITTVNSLGIAKVNQLDAKQLIDMTLVGGLVGMFLYLKQSPVPPDDGNTNFMVNPISPIKPVDQPAVDTAQPKER